MPGLNTCASLAATRSVLLAVLASAPLSAQRVLATAVGEGIYHEYGAVVAALRDIDGDRVGDWAVASGSDSLQAPYVHIRSGRTGVLIRRLVGPFGQDWGVSIADIGDVNADAVSDVAVGAPNRQAGSSVGAIDIYSGRDGALIASIIEDSGNRTELGRRVAGVDDLDGDGVSDFVAVASEARTLRVYSGRTRVLIRSLSFGTTGQNAIPDIALGGDVNGDGVRDLIAGDAGWSEGEGRVMIFNLRNGATLRVISGDPTQNSRFGTAVAGLGDVDGDGTPDLAATAPNRTDAGSFLTGAVSVHSGRTGARLAAAYGSRLTDLGVSLATIADVDGDGAADLVAGAADARGTQGSQQGRVLFVSARTGAILMQMEGVQSPSRFGSACAGVSDMDGDSVPDVLVGAPSEDGAFRTQGVARILSGRVVAQAVAEGAGCGGGPFVPMLGGTRPVVGTVVHLVGDMAPPAPGFVLMSLPPGRAVNLGVPECNAFVDLGTGILLASVPAGTRWSLPLPVPALPGLALSFQVVYGPTLGPLGFDLTGGLHWRIGW